ncbi:MAG: hypothetical protein COA57_00835 [Flavobacteriales bacterium]|nr:MAG: hypothetical protein COA57_00835 [Flavobacteriales bacterium]
MVTVRFSAALLVFCFVTTMSFGLTDGTASGDSINQIDNNNLKQGHWIYTGEMLDKAEYKPKQKVEEGLYVDNRKNGNWKLYFPNENPRAEITFVNNRPDGHYKTYYKDGTLEEEGTFINRKQVGDFKRYHENGNIAQIKHFSHKGKSNGSQQYFHTNGQVELEFTTINGKEDGEMRRFYPDGRLKEEKIFNDGVVDIKSVKKYEYEDIDPTDVYIQEEEVPDLSLIVPIIDKPNLGNTKDPVNTCEGTHTLYNKNLQISMIGDMKKCRLKNGKRYVYDENGLLVKIMIFKKFKYVGDAIIEKEDQSPSLFPNK